MSNPWEKAGNTFKRTTRLRRAGGSFVVRLPKIWVDINGVWSGDELLVDIIMGPSEIIIRKVGTGDANTRDGAGTAHSTVSGELGLP